MRNSRKQMIKTFALIVTLLGTAVFAHAEEDPLKFQSFMIPEGNATKGRQAFIDFKCNTCHNVAGEIDLPFVNPQKVGPTLTFNAQTRSNEEIATAIILPSHTIAEGFAQGTVEDEPKSSMVDYTEIMTIRQLSDLVAYLRSNKE